MNTKAQYLTQSKVEKKFPEFGYLMTLNLSHEEVAELLGIEFTKEDNINSDIWAAYIRFDVSPFVFQFRHERTDSPQKTVVAARGRDIDLREAYSRFTEAFKIPGKHIGWMSDNL